MTFKLTILWLHILSIVAWIGGWLFLLILWLPVKGGIRSMEALQLTQRLTRSARFVASRGLELLILTGIFNFLIRMVQGGLHSAYHSVLGMKLVLVVASVVIQLVEGRAFSTKREALLSFSIPFSLFLRAQLASQSSTSPSAFSSSFWG